MTTKDKLVAISAFDGLVCIVSTLLRLGYYALDQHPDLQIISAVLMLLIGLALIIIVQTIRRRTWKQTSTARIAQIRQNSRVGWGLSLSIGGVMLLTGVIVGPLWQEQTLALDLSMIAVGLGLILLGAWLYVGAKFTQKPKPSSEKL